MESETETAGGGGVETGSGVICPSPWELKRIAGGFLRRRDDLTTLIVTTWGGQ